MKEWYQMNEEEVLKMLDADKITAARAIFL